MDERTPLQRMMQDNLLRWTTAAASLVLYVVVIALIEIRSPQVAKYLELVGLGLVAIHFIFTVSNEARRNRQTRVNEKAKRQRLEVGDDGELIEIVETEEEQQRHFAQH